MVRCIVERVPEDLLQKDLEKYRQRAIELGATDAKIITTDLVVIDERVRAKCIYPKCMFYGTNAHCPPHGMDLDQARKIVKSFRYGIFSRMQVPSDEFAGQEAMKKNLMARGHLNNYAVASKIEAEAFYDGYYLALGFACGPCKPFFCPGKECQALILGKTCRHRLRGRSSMEGAGMDVFMMATKVGWDTYPIGASTVPSDVPFGATYSLVLIY